MNTCKESNKHLMQGDQYNIPIEIILPTGPANATSFENIEIQMGNIRKTLLDNEITYSEEKKAFLFPLKQKETFRLKQGQVEVQVRVKLHSGEIIGTSAGYYNVEDAVSKTEI